MLLYCMLDQNDVGLIHRSIYCHPKTDPFTFRPATGQLPHNNIYSLFLRSPSCTSYSRNPFASYSPALTILQMRSEPPTESPSLI
jgi:hypothetical protein